MQKKEKTKSKTKLTFELQTAIAIASLVNTRNIIKRVGRNAPGVWPSVVFCLPKRKKCS